MKLFDATLFSFLLLTCFGGLTLAEEEKPKATQSIAILYFENNNDDDRELQRLSKGLCSMMIEHFQDTSDMKVIERARIQSILSELEMTRGPQFDQATVAKIGKLVGAEYLVFGSYFEIFKKFTISARVVKVETGVIVTAAGVSGKADSFDTLQKNLSNELLTKISGVKKVNSKHLAGKEGQAEPVASKVSVSNVAKYGDALDLFDKGEKPGARKILMDIVEANPDFSVAKTMLETMASKSN